MQLTSFGAVLLMGLGASALGGCTVLGAVKQANVPYDPHPAPPTAIEIAANPCKFGDVAACIARCQGGESGACYSLGVRFEISAETNPGDSALASGFYGRACESSYAPGCTNLAWLYALGRGVPRDPVQSLALFTKAYEASKLACRRGDMSGCMMAGELLLEGRGVESDEALAMTMFKTACDHGERRGCDYVESMR